MTDFLPRPERDAAILVLCAVPSDFACEVLAGKLVADSLAACVQIGPPITSVYRWQGALETSSERLLIMKTRPSLFGALEAAIRAGHPYEVPEIVAIPIVAAHAPYLAWLEAMTSDGSRRLADGSRGDASSAR